MQPISEAKHNDIIAGLISGASVFQIVKSTGVGQCTVTKICSQYCAHLPKSAGGHPGKLTATNMRHALHLISSGKVENAVQITRSLKDITNTSITPQTVCRHLKKAGMKAVTKKERPKLTKKHK